MKALRSLILTASAVVAAAAYSQSIYLSAPTPNDFQFQYFPPSASQWTTGGFGNAGMSPGSSFSITQDAIYQLGFWYRSATQPREYQVCHWTSVTTAPDGKSGSATAREEVSGVGNALEFTIQYQLVGNTPEAAYLKVNWSVKNLRNVSQVVQFFPYADLQTEADPFFDKVTFDPLTTTFKYDSVNNDALIYFRNLGQAPIGYESASYSALRGKLVDSLATDFVNTVPSNTGDRATAFQYELALPAGATESGSVGIGYNMVPPVSYQLTGNVNLADYLGDNAQRPVTVELRTPGTQTVLGTQTFTLSNQGSFVLDTTLFGMVDVALTAPGFLRKVLPNVNLSNNPTISASLVNGDIDLDNSVTIFDYIQLSWNFDQNVGDEGVNALADLDGDGSITIFDYIVLSQSFDLTGDL